MKKCEHDEGFCPSGICNKCDRYHYAEVISELREDNDKMLELLKSFIMFDACKREWVDEMQATVEAVIKEIENEQ